MEKDIVINQAYIATFEFQDSASGDTVTYSILTSSGASFATGNAVWVGNGLWKVTFTPVTDGEVYLVVVTNSTLDVKRSGSYRGTLKSVQTTVEVGDTDAASMLVAVNNAILGILNGGGTKQYQINGRMVTYEDLDKLRAMRRELMAEVQSARSAYDQHTNVEFDAI